MTIATGKKYWTDEELLAIPKDGYKREIVNGELCMSPAGFNHGTIAARILTALSTFVYARKLGDVADGQTGFRLETGDVFSPDVSFVTASRVAEYRRKNLPSTFFAGAPDLAVEVLSPSDTIGLMEEKLAHLFAEGTRLAWVVHPRTKIVMVYHGVAADKLLRISDSLDGEDIVPGFSLALKSVFD